MKTLKNQGKEWVNLKDTGEFHTSLADKVIHVGINKGGGEVIVGISEKP